MSKLVTAILGMAAMPSEQDFKKMIVSTISGSDTVENSEVLGRMNLYSYKNNCYHCMKNWAEFTFKRFGQTPGRFTPMEDALFYTCNNCNHEVIVPWKSVNGKLIAFYNHIKADRK